MHLGRNLALSASLIIVALALVGCSSDDGGTPTQPARVPVVTQITDDPAFEANPLVSPDGQWIYYERRDLENPHDHDLMRVATAGGDPQALTSGEWHDTSMGLSPAGDRLIFESDRSGTKSLWLIDLAAGGDPVQITDDTAADGDPAWSPVAQRIVFASNREGSNGLWLIDPDTRDLTRITNGEQVAYHRTPDWSPDGEEIVFESDREGSSALYVLTVETGDVRRVTELFAYEGHPAWSPDGREIAFESRRTGTMEIYVVDPDGANAPFQVTNLGGYWPQWSPDSSQIVYAVYGSGEPNLWAVDVDWR